MPWVETTRQISVSDEDREQVMAREEYQAAGELCRAALQRGGRPFGTVRRTLVEEGAEETWLFELEYAEPGPG
jgi:hypothetical protein